MRGSLTISVLMSASMATMAAPPSEKFGPGMQAALAQKSRVPAILTLDSQANTAKIAASQKGDARIVAAVTALREEAERSQAPVRKWLDSRGVSYRAFWAANVISVDVTEALAMDLAKRGDIARIELDSPMKMIAPVDAAASDADASKAIESGVTRVNAPALWAMGFRGQGVLVAGEDTGIQWDHPALKGKYAGWNGTTADHNYHWRDAIGAGGSGGSCGVSTQAPCDDNSHGTHTVGTMVGDDGGSNQIGVAPRARWIGCRNMDQGNGTPTTYIDCMQWMMAPTQLNGSNPDPLRAPHVVNNSWGCPASEGCTTPDILRTVVENVRNAGILMVVSSGNSGSSCSTILDPPGFYEASFSVGAIGTTSMASFSSRGPVTQDGSGRLKPDIVAPGVSTRSSVPGGGYGASSGTSMAGPHVAGVAALLMSIDPTLKRDPARIEQIMRSTAVNDINNTQVCGGIPAATIPNNVVGYGRIDALSAARNGLGVLGVGGFE